MKITPFQQKVYQMISKIPEGKVTSYGAIAIRLGSSPRAVGQALKKNPFAPAVPCHRVISANGMIGGFMGKTSGQAIARKISLLKKEGVKINGRRILKEHMI